MAVTGAAGVVLGRSVDVFCVVVWVVVRLVARVFRWLQNVATLNAASRTSRPAVAYLVFLFVRFIFMGVRNLRL